MESEQSKELKMYQYKNGKQRKITMNVGIKFITDSNHNNKLVKLNKIEAIHLGKASKGLQKLTSPHDVCFSIIKKKKFGRETLDFETKRLSHRTYVIFNIIENMQSFGLSAGKVEMIKSMVLNNENQDEILKIPLDPQKIVIDAPIKMEPTEWTVCWHKDGKRPEIVMVIDSETITDGKAGTNILNLIEIQEIQLWNGTDGFQDDGGPSNVSFSIIQYTAETGWKTSGFEMSTMDDRTGIIIDILDKLQCLGVYPLVEDGITRQIVLDSMESPKTFQIRVMLHPDGPPEATTVINQNADESDDSDDIEKGFTFPESMEQPAVSEEKYNGRESESEVDDDTRKLHQELQAKDDLIKKLEDERRATEMENQRLREELILQNEIDVRGDANAEIHRLAADLDALRGVLERVTKGEGEKLKMVNADLSEKFQNLERDLDTKISGNDAWKMQMPSDSKSTENKELTMYLFQHKNGKKRKIAMNIGSDFIIDSEHNNKLVKLNKIEAIHLGKASKGLKKVTRPHNVCFSIIKKKRFGREKLHFEVRKASHRTDVLFQIMENMQSFGLSAKALAVMEAKVLSNQKQDEVLEISLDPQTIAALTVHVLNNTASKMETTAWKVCGHKRGKRQQIVMVVDSEAIIDGRTETKILNLIEIQEIHLWNGTDGFQDVNSPQNVSFSIIQYSDRTGWNSLGFSMSTTEDRSAIIFDIMDKLKCLRVYPIVEDGLTPQIVIEKMGSEETFQIRVMYYADITPEEMDRMIRQTVEMEKGLRSPSCTESMELLLYRELEKEQLAVSEEKYSGMDFESDVSDTHKLVKVLEDLKAKNGKQRETLAQQSEAIQILKDEKEVIMKANYNLQHRLSAEIHKFDTQNKEMDDLRSNKDSEIQRLKAEMEDLRGELAAHQSDMNKVQSDLAKEGEAWRMTNADLLRDLDAQIKANDVLKHKTNTLRQESSSAQFRLKCELDANKVTINNLEEQKLQHEAQLKEFDERAKAHEQLLRDHEIQKKENNDLRESTGALQDSLSAMKNELLLQNEMMSEQQINYEQLNEKQKQLMQQQQITEEEAEERYLKMKKKYESEKTMNQELRDKLVSHGEQVAAQRHEFNQQYHANEQLLREQVMLKKKNSELLHKVATESKKNKNMMNQADTDRARTDSEILNLQADLDKARVEMAAYQMEMDNVQKQQHENHAELMGQLMGQLAAKNQELVAQRKLVVDARAKYEQLGLQQEEFMKQLAVKSKDYREMVRKYKSEHKAIVEQRKQIIFDHEETDASIKRLNSDLDSTRSALTEQRSQNEAQRKEMDQWEAAHEKLISEQEIIKNENETLREQINAHLGETDSKLQALESALEDTHRQLKEQSAQNEQYQTEQVLKESETHQLQKELAAEMQKNETQQKAISDLQKELALNRTEIDSLENQRNTLHKKSSAEIEQLRSTVYSNKTEIVKLTGDIDQLQDSILEKDEELMKQREELERASKATEQLQEKDVMIEKENLELKQKLIEEMEESEALRSQMDNYRGETDEEIERLKSDLSDAREDLNERNKDIYDLKGYHMRLAYDKNKEIMRQRTLFWQEMEQNEIYRNQIKDMVADRARANSEIEQLKSNLDDLRKELQQKLFEEMERNEALKKEMGDNQEQLEHADSKIERLNFTLEKLREEQSTHRIELEQLQKDSIEEVVELKMANTEITEKYQKICQVLHDEKEKNKGLKHQMDTEQKTGKLEMKRLKTTLNANKVTVSDLSERNREMEDSVSALVSKQEDLQQEYVEMKAKFAAEREITEQKEKQMVSDREETKIRIQELNSNLDDARDEVQEQRAQNEAERKELDQQRAANEQLQQELLILEKEKEELQRKWNEEIESLQEQSDIHRTETESAIQRLKADLDELREDAAKTTEQLDRQISSKIRENDNLRNEMDTLRQNNSMKIEDLQSTIDVNQIEIDSLKDEIHEMERRCKAQLKVVQDLKEQIISDRQKTAASIKCLNSDLEATRSELSEQRALSREQRKELDQRKEARHQLVTELENMKKIDDKLLQTWIAKHGKNEELSNQMEAHLEETYSKLQALESDLDDARKRLKEQSAENEQYQLEHEVMVKTVDQLDQEISSKIGENDNLKEKIHELEDSLSAKNEELNQRNEAGRRLVTEVVNMKNIDDELHQKWIAKQKKNEQLSNQMNAHLEEIYSKLRALESKLDDHRRVLKEQRAQNARHQLVHRMTDKRLKVEKKQLNVELSEKIKENENLRDQMEQLRQQWNEEIEALSKQSDIHRIETESAIQRLKSDLNELRGEHSIELDQFQKTLNEEYEQNQALNHEMDSLRQRITGLQSTVDADEIMIDDLCDRNLVLQDTATAMKSKFVAQKALIAEQNDLMRQLSVSEKKYVQIKEKLDGEKRKNKDQKKQMVFYRGETEARIKRLESNLDIVQSELTEQRARNEAQQNELYHQQAAYKQSTRDLLIMEEQRDQLQKQWNEEMESLKVLAVELSSGMDHEDTHRLETDSVIRRLEFGLERLEGELAAREMEIENIRKIAKKTEEQLNEEISSKMKENDNLRNQMDTLRQDTSSRIRDLQSLIDVNQIQINNLGEGIDELESSLSTKIEQLAAQEKLIMKQEKEYEQLEMKRKELERQKTASEENLREMERVHKSERKMSQEQIANLSERIRNLRDSALKKDSELATLRTEQKRDCVIIKKLEDEVTTLKKKNDELQYELSAQLQTNKALKKQREKLEADREKADSEIESLGYNLSKLRGERSAHRIELEQFQKDSIEKEVELKMANTEIIEKYQRISQVLHDEKEKNKGLKHQMETLQKTSKLEMKRLQTTLNANKVTMRKEIDQRNEERRQLLAELQNMKNIDDQLQQKWTAKQKKNEELIYSKLQALESNLKDTRRHLKEQRAQKEQYQLELEVTEKRLTEELQKRESLQEAVSNLQEKVSDQQKEMDNIREEKEQLNGKLNDQDKENGNSMNQIERLKSALDQQRSANEQLEHDLLSMKMEKDQLRQEWDDEIEALSKQSDIQRIQTDSAIQRLKSDLNELRGERQKELGQFREDAAKTVKQLNKEISFKMKDNHDLLHRMDSLRQETSSKIEHLQSTIDTNQMVISNLKEGMHELEDSLSEKNQQLVAHKDVIIKQEVKCQRADAKQNELVQQLGASEKKYYEMEQDLKKRIISDREKTAASIKRLNSDLDVTRSELKEQRAQNEAQLKELNQRTEARRQLVTELENMKKIDDKLQQKWTAKQQKYEEISNQMSAHLKETDSKLQASESDLDDTRRRLNEQRAQEEQYQQDKELMEQKLETKQQQCETIQKAMSDLQEALVVNRTAMDHIREDTRAVKDRLNRKLNDKVKENDNLMIQTDILMKEKSAEIKQLRSKLDADGMQIGNLTDKIGELQHSILAKDAANKELLQKDETVKKENHDLMSKLSSEMAQSETLRSQMDLYQGETEEEIQRLKSDLDDSRRELKRVHNESIMDIEKGMVEIGAKNHELEDIVAAKEATIEKLKSNLLGQELTEERAQNELYLRERVVMESKLVDERQKSDTLQRAISDLRNELAAHRTEMDHIRGDSREERVQLNRELMDKIKENEHLKNEVDSLRKESSAEIVQLRNTVDSNKIEIGNFIEKMGELQDSILAKDAELMKHREDLERQSGANKQLRSIHEEMQKEKDQLRQEWNGEIEDLSKQSDIHRMKTESAIQRLKSDLDELREEHSVHQMEMVRLQELLNDKNKQNEALKHQMNSLQQDSNADIEWLQSTVDANEIMIDDLSRKNHELQQSLLAVNEDHLAQKELVEEQEDKCVGMRMQIADLSGTICDLQDSVLTKDSALVKLQADLKREREPNKKMEDERATMEKENDILKHKLTGEIEKNEALREKMKDNRERADSEIWRLKCILDELHVELSLYQMDLGQFQEESMTKVEALRMADAEFVVQRDLAVEYRLKYEELDVKQKELMQQLEAEEEKYDELERKYNEEKQINQEQRRQIMSELEETKARIERLNSDLKAIRSELEEQRTVNNAQRKELYQRNKARRQLLIDELQQRSAAKQGKNEELSKQTNAHLEGTYSKLQALESNLNDTRRELKEQRAQNEEHQVDRNVTDKRLTDEMRKCETLQKAMNDLQEKLSAGRKVTERRLNERRAMHNEQKERNCELQNSLLASNLELMAQKELIAKLRADHQELNRKHKIVMQQLAAKEKENDEIDHEYEAEMELRQGLQEQIVGGDETVMVEIDRLKSDLDVTRSDFEKQRAENQSQRQLLVVMTEAEEELTESLKAQAAEVLRLSTELDNVQQELTDKNTDMERLRTRHNGVNGDLDEMKERNRELQDSSLASNLELVAQKELVVKLRSDHEELNTKHKILMEQLAAKEEKNDEMDHEYGTGTVQELSVQIVGVDETLMFEIERLKSDLNVTRSELEEQRAENESQRQELEQKSEAHEQLQCDMEIMGTEKDEMQQQWSAEYEILSKQSDTHRIETETVIHRLKSELDHLRELSRIHQEMDAFQQNAAKRNKNKRSIKVISLAKLVEQSNIEIFDGMKENEDLKNQIETLKKEKSADMEQLRSTLDAKKVEIEILTKRISELQDFIFARDAALIQQREKLEWENEANEQLQEKEAMVEPELKQKLSLEIRYDEFLRSLTSLHHGEEDEKIQRLKPEIDDPRRELKDQQMEMEQAQEDLVVAHEESIVVNERAIGKLEARNRELEALVAEKEATIKKLEFELSGMKTTINEWTKNDGRKEETLKSQLVIMMETEEEISESLKDQTEEVLRLKLDLDKDAPVPSEMKVFDNLDQRANSVPIPEFDRESVRFSEAVITARRETKLTKSSKRRSTMYKNKWHEQESRLTIAMDLAVPFERSTSWRSQETTPKHPLHDCFQQSTPDVNHIERIRAVEENNESEINIQKDKTRELQDSTSTLIMDQQDLQRRLSTTENKVIEMKEKVDLQRKDTENQEKQMVSDRKETEARIQRLNSYLDDAREELQEQRALNEAQQRVIEQQQAENDQLQRERIVMEKEWNEEIETLRKQSDIHRIETDSAIQRLKSDLNELRGERQRELDQFQKDSAKAMERLNREISSQMKENNDLKKQMESLRQDDSSKKKLYRKHRRKIIPDELNVTRRELQDPSLRAEHEELSMKHRELMQQLKETEERNEEMEQKYEAEMKELIDQRNEVEDSLLTEQQLMPKEIEELQQKWTAERQKNEELRNQLNDHLKEAELKLISSWGNEHSEAEEENLELMEGADEGFNEFRDKIDEIQSALDDSRQEVADKDTNIERLRTVYDEMKRERDKLKERNRELQESSFASNLELVAQKELIEKLRAEHEELNLNQRVLMQQLSTTQESHVEMNHEDEAEMKVHPDQKEQIKEDHETALSEIERLKSDLNVTRSDLEEQRAENDAQRQELEQKSEAHEQLRCDFVKMEKQKEELRQEWIAEIEALSKQSDIHRIETESVVQRLKSDLEELRELSINQKEIDKFLEQTNNSKDQSGTLRKGTSEEIDALQSAVDENEIEFEVNRETNRELQLCESALRAALLAQKYLQRKVSIAESECVEMKEKFDAERKVIENREKQMVLDRKETENRVQRLNSDLDVAREELQEQRALNEAQQKVLDQQRAANEQLQQDRIVMEKEWNKEIEALGKQSDIHRIETESTIQRLKYDLDQLRGECHKELDQFREDAAKTAERLNREISSKMKENDALRQDALPAFRDSTSAIDINQLGIDNLRERTNKLEDSLSTKNKELVAQEEMALVDNEMEPKIKSDSASALITQPQDLQRKLSTTKKDVAMKEDLKVLDLQESELRIKKQIFAFDDPQKELLIMERDEEVAALSEQSDIHRIETESTAQRLKSDRNDHEEESRTRSVVGRYSDESLSLNRPQSVRVNSENEEIARTQHVIRRYTDKNETVNRQINEKIRELHDSLSAKNEELVAQKKLIVKQHAEHEVPNMEQWESVQQLVEAEEGCDLRIIGTDKDQLGQEWNEEIEALSKQSDIDRIETDSVLQPLKFDLDQLQKDRKDETLMASTLKVKELNMELRRVTGTLELRESVEAQLEMIQNEMEIMIHQQQNDTLLLRMSVQDLEEKLLHKEQEIERLHDTIDAFEAVTRNHQQSVRIDDEHEERVRIREENESVTRIRHDVSRDNHRQEAVTKTNRLVARFSDGIEENTTIRAQVGRANHKNEVVLRNQPSVSRLNGENETFTLHREQRTRIKSEMEEVKRNDPQIDRVKDECEVVKRSRKQNTHVRDGIEEVSRVRSQTIRFNDRNDVASKRPQSLRINDPNEEVQRIHPQITREIDEFEAVTPNHQQSVRIDDVHEEVKRIRPQIDRINDENEVGWDRPHSTRVQNEMEEVKRVRPQIGPFKDENENSLRRQQSSRITNGNEEVVRVRPQIARINDTNEVSLQRLQSARIEKFDETDGSEDIEKGFTFPDEENKEVARVRSHVDRVNDNNESVTWNRPQSVRIDDEHEEVGRIRQQIDRVNDEQEVGWDRQQSTRVQNEIEEVKRIRPQIDQVRDENEVPLRRQQSTRITRGNEGDDAKTVEQLHPEITPKMKKNVDLRNPMDTLGQDSDVRIDDENEEIRRIEPQMDRINDENEVGWDRQLSTRVQNEIEEAERVRPQIDRFKDENEVSLRRQQSSRITDGSEEVVRVRPQIARMNDTNDVSLKRQQRARINDDSEEVAKVRPQLCRVNDKNEAVTLNRQQSVRVRHENEEFARIRPQIGRIQHKNDTIDRKRRQNVRVSDQNEEFPRDRPQVGISKDEDEAFTLPRQQSIRVLSSNEEVQRIRPQSTREIDAFEAITWSNQQSVRIDDEREEVRRIRPHIDRINDENEIGRDRQQSTRVHNESEEVKMLRPQIDQVREEIEVSLRRQQSTPTSNGNEKVVRVRPQIARINETNELSLQRQQSARMDPENEEVTRVRPQVGRINDQNEFVTWNRQQSVRIDDEHEEVKRIRTQIDRINDENKVGWDRQQSTRVQNEIDEVKRIRPQLDCEETEQTICTSARTSMLKDVARKGGASTEMKVDEYVQKESIQIENDQAPSEMGVLEILDQRASSVPIPEFDRGSLRFSEAVITARRETKLTKSSNRRSTMYKNKWHEQESRLTIAMDLAVPFERSTSWRSQKTTTPKLSLHDSRKLALQTSDKLKVDNTLQAKNQESERQELLQYQRQEIDDLKKKLEEKHAENDRLIAQNKELELTMTKMAAKELSDHSSSVSQIENHTLSDLIIQRPQIQQIQQERAMADTKLIDEMRKYGTLQETTADRRDELSVHPTDMDHIRQDSKEDRKGLNAELSHKSNQNDNVKSEMETLEKVTSAEIQQSTFDVDDMESEEKLSLAMKQNEILRGQMNVYREETAKEIQRLRSDLDDSRCVLEKHKEEIETKERVISEIGETNHNLEVFIAAKDAMIEKLKSYLSGMKKLNTELTEYEERQYDAIESHMEMMEEEIEDFNEQKYRSEMEVRVDLQERVVGGVEMGTADVERLNADLGVTRSELKEQRMGNEAQRQEFQKRSEAQEQLLDDSTMAKTEKEELPQEWSGIMKENQILKGQMDIHQQKFSEKMQQSRSTTGANKMETETMTDRKRELRDSIVAKDVTVMKQREALEQESTVKEPQREEELILENGVEELNKTMRNKIKEIVTEMQYVLGKKNDKLQHMLSIEIEKHQIIRNGMYADREGTHSFILRLKFTLNELRKDLITKQIEIDKLEKEAANTVDELKMVKQDLSIQMKENDALKQEMDTLRRESSLQNVTIEDLSGRFSGLQHSMWTILRAICGYEEMNHEAALIMIGVLIVILATVVGYSTMCHLFGVTVLEASRNDTSLEYSANFLSNILLGVLPAFVQSIYMFLL